MDILYNTKNFAVIYKSALVPSQPDETGTPDALTLTCEELKSRGERSELFVIHRLDLVVSGLLVFAKNKKSAAALSLLVSGDGIGKEYLAVVDGESEGGELRDYLSKDNRLRKATVTSPSMKGAKEAILTAEPLTSVDTDHGVKTLLLVRLKTGRFHQIRAQLSSRGTPITGDGKYGSRDSLSRTPALASVRLAFSLPPDKVDIRRAPDTSVYPWSLFSDFINNLDYFKW